MGNERGKSFMKRLLPPLPQSTGACPSLSCLSPGVILDTSPSLNSHIQRISSSTRSTFMICQESHAVPTLLPLLCTEQIASLACIFGVCSGLLFLPLLPTQKPEFSG